MADLEFLGESLQERALSAIQQLLDRAMAHVDGVERVVLRQTIQLFYPRLERTIRNASEDKLSQEIEHIRALLDAVLPQPTDLAGTGAVQKRRTRRRRPSRRT
jgi:hypothetical protein